MFYSNAQFKAKLQLKDFNIKSNDVTAFKETYVTHVKDFGKEFGGNYTFNTDGYLTSDNFNSKITYQNSYEKVIKTSRDENKLHAYFIIKTPIVTYLADTKQVKTNSKGVITNIFFKSEDGKYDSNLEITYSDKLIMVKPDVDYLDLNIFTEKGLLIKEFNKSMGNYYNAYDSKTNLQSVRIFNMSNDPTLDLYMIYLYEFDSYGNWIVKYHYESLPIYGNKLDNLKRIEVREINYKNGIKTGYSSVNQEIKNKGLAKIKTLNIEKLDKVDFPVYYDYKEKIVTNAEVISTNSNCEGDCQNGWGKYTYENGTYTGFWKNGKKSGFGFYVWNNKANYYGEWEDDKMIGFSQYTYPNGNQYFGNFLNSKFHGNGVVMIKETGKNEFNYYENGNPVRKLDYYDNNVTKGCVTGNCQNGFGRYIFDNGTAYIGNFENYKLVKGFMVFTNGDAYMGNFNTLSQFHGYGFYNYANNKGFYYGYWKNNKKEGKAYAVANEKFEIGEYLDNKFVKSLEQ